MDVVGIITAAIKAATDGILATQTTSPATSSGTSNPEDKISELKWLHLRIICNVALFGHIVGLRLAILQFNAMLNSLCIKITTIIFSPWSGK